MGKLNRILAALVAVMLLACSSVAFAEDGDEGEEDEDSGSKPAVVVLGVTELSETGARAMGEVKPGGRTTAYVFEYGPTTAYGEQSPSASVGGSSWRAVSARLDGLQAGTTYHYRLVATNVRGTVASAARTFTTPSAATSDAPPAPEDAAPEGEAAPVQDGEGAAVEPKLATSVAVGPGRGAVRVRRPGHSTFVPLESGSELPIGAEVDARRGGVTLTAALPSGETQTGRFGGGRFVIRQTERGRVDLHLRGRACPRRSVAHGSAVAQASRKRRRSRSRRRLWGRDKGGRFRTHGRHSHATVRGTRWVVADRCDGTLTRVTEGSVVVRDKVRRKRVIVRVGERYLARPRR